VSRRVDAQLIRAAARLLPRSPRGIVVATALALCVVPAALAVQASAGPVASTESVTLKIWTDTGWSFISAAAAQFQKSHPNVKVVQTSLTFQQSIPYFANLPRNLAAAGAPDISTVRVQPGPWYEVLRQRLVVPINDVWQKAGLAKAYSRDTVSLFSARDGKHYAIGIDRWWPVVWFNKAAFAKAGITAPAKGRIPSQAQLFAWGKALKRAGYSVPLAIGTTDEQGPSYIFGQLVQSACGNKALFNLENNWKPGVARMTRWTSPCVMKALEATKLYATNGLLGPSPATESDEQAQTYFGQSKAGMFLTGSWGQALFEGSKFTIPFSWLLLPPVPGGSPTQPAQASYDGLAVVRSSKHKDLAKEFLALIAAKQFMSSKAYATSFTLAPARTDVTISSPPYPSAIGEMVAAFPRLGGTVPALYTTIPWGLTVSPTIASMWSGSKSTSQVAAIFERAAVTARANPTG
jgi:raffinose/stachyose/melibiose transport system substrate-binding protein